MSTRTKVIGMVVALATLGAIAVPLVARMRTEGDQGPNSPTTAAKAEKAAAAAPEDRKADREAIRQSIEKFRRAVEKRDAKAVAACWTAEGEYIADDGRVLRGRAAIEKGYGAFFAKNQSIQALIRLESLRFVSKDTAIEEGHFKLTTGEETTWSRYSAMHVREGGRWLLAVVRDWPESGTSTRDLEWLVGSWASKRNGREVTTTYSWDESKTFLVGRYAIKEQGKTTTGMQVIAKSPESGEVHSWTFEADGGLGEATWTLDGKHWVIESRGVLPDGTVMTAKNLLTPIDRNSFTWQVTARAENEESLPDLPPVKVTRVKKSNN